MVNEVRDVLKESHVYLLFGFEFGRCEVIEHGGIVGKDMRDGPLVIEPETFVTPKRSKRQTTDEPKDSGDEEMESNPSPVESNVENRRQMHHLGNFVLAAVFIALCIYFLYNPPPVVDNLVNVVMRDCPEKTQLDVVQGNLNRCETKHRTTAETLTRRTIENGEVMANLEGCRQGGKSKEEKLREAESIVASFKDKLKVADEKISDFEERTKEQAKRLYDVTKEKDVLSGKLEDVQLKFGTCNNKNMDHEISNAALLSEVESLKKQVEKC